MRILLLILLVLLGYKEVFATGLHIKDVVLIPSEGNKMSYKITNEDNLKVYPSVEECEVYEVVDPKLKRSKVVKTVKYTSYLSFDGEEDKPFDGVLEINGIKAQVRRNGAVRFALRENCTKLYPVAFTSAEKQIWNGHQIDKGAQVQIGRLEGKLGPQDEFGYEREDFLDFKNLKAGDIAGTSRELLDRHCVRVRYPSNYNNGNPPGDYYLFKDKKYPTDYRPPEYWSAKSKYITNILCSDRPDMSLIHTCGSRDVPDQVDIVWSDYKRLQEMYPQEMYPEDALSEEERLKLVKRAKELGKKCDKVVAEYEKKTGIKIPPYKYIREEYLKEEEK